MKIIKEALSQTRDLCWECLEIIDAAQRLCIDNQFQEEIEAVLKRQYEFINANHFDGDMDLHKAALLFRLLRQQGYLVSAGSYSTLYKLHFVLVSFRKTACLDPLKDHFYVKNLGAGNFFFLLK